MKVHIILLYCLCRSLAITVNYKTTGSTSVKEYKESLKAIRQVSVNKPEPFPKPVLIPKPKGRNEFVRQLTTVEEPEVIQQSLEKSKEEQKNIAVAPRARVDDSQRDDSNNKAQVKKIADQLYLAQKRAFLLSDYQKFILSQDTNVKNFVLGQSVQSRSPIPFSLKRPSVRSLWTQPKAEYVTTEPPAEGRDSNKIVAVTPKVVGKISKPKNDHKGQATHIKYVTLAPQSLAHAKETYKPNQKVTILQYHIPQQYTYYNLGVTSKPQVEIAQISTTAAIGLGSHEMPQTHYHQQEDGHEDNINHDDSKYEFMYKVKDQENNSNFGHKESRSDKTTYGYYFVQLPDGRLETVKYWADKTGYHAKVYYQGQAKHPTYTDHNVNFQKLVYH